MIAPDSDTISSVLIALAIWDGVMFATLGTSPVFGFILGGQGASDPTRTV